MTRNNTRIKLAGAAAMACALGMAASSANAAFLTFTDRALWEAAVSGVVTEDLNSVATDINFTNGSTTIGALTFSHVGTGDIQIDAPPLSLPGSGAAGIDGTTFLDVEPLDAGTRIAVALGGTYLGFGVDYLNYDNSGDRAEFFVNGTSVGVTDLDVGDGALGFLGVVATPDMAFTSFEIGNATAGSLFHGFDNFSVASAAAAVPVPSTLLTLMAGMLGLGFARRKSA